jgi:hypothetical protein
MRSKGYSEYHQNNNLKVIITFSNFIRSTFYDINKTEQILEFLIKKLKDRIIMTSNGWMDN